MAGIDALVRDHPASEVYVTGTFDDWKKTVQLEKVGDSFEKEVTLPDASKKIFYKFVVDGDWVTDPTAPLEVDESGIDNNVLTPERIVSEAPATTAIMSSVAPESSTAALAAKVPLEKKPATEGKVDSDVKHEGNEKKDDEGATKDESKKEEEKTAVDDAEGGKADEKGVSPMKGDLPGTFPETPAATPNAEPTFSVNPLPAAAGAVNPIKLAPGEEVPKEITSENTNSNVKLDPESYEKSDTLPGDAPFAISSAAPESSTAALAANVPIEPKVPAIVKESQEKAHVDPEASAVPSEVEEKAALEKELLEKVKEAPPASEGTAEGSTGKASEKSEDVTKSDEIASAAASSSPAADGNAEKPAETKEPVPETKAVESGSSKAVKPVEAEANGAPHEKALPEVPIVVKESIAEAGISPEGTTNPEAVEEKAAVEAQLLKEVKPAEAAKPAEVAKESPKTDAPLATEAPASTETPEVKETPALAVPSTTTAPDTSVAAATTETPAVAASEPKESNTTTETPNTPAAADATEAQAAESSKSAEQKTATNGDKAAVDGPVNGDKKKKHRLSTIFGKVKAKLTHKH
ncbi:hypothetical protein GGR50DRAFT_704650 [Xylaria sp. CBS 124048]|nr:hypothetical protein GGR50DRAFT_704650 [Xylaria sp. CBS 124048]